MLNLSERATREFLLAVLYLGRWGDVEEFPLLLDYLLSRDTEVISLLNRLTPVQFANTIHTAYLLSKRSR